MFVYSGNKFHAQANYSGRNLNVNITQIIVVSHLIAQLSC